MLAQERGAQALVADEEGGGDQSDGHDLGVAHLGLRVILVAPGAQEVVAKAVECDNIRTYAVDVGGSERSYCA